MNQIEIKREQCATAALMRLTKNKPPKKNSIRDKVVKKHLNKLSSWNIK